MSFGLGFGFPRMLRVAGTAWTPANLGSALSLWLDASDSSTITLNGSTVSQWNDKSGNARHVSQATATNQPTYSATGLNGKGSLSFDGSDDILSTPTAFPSLDNFSVFVVASGNAIAANQERGIVAIDNGTGSGYISGYWFERSSWGQALTSYISSATVGAPLNSLPTNGFTAKILGQVRTKNVDHALFIDGNFYNVTANNTTLTATIPSNRLYIGRSALTYSGTISEVTVFNTSLSTTDRQKLEGYFAWKWGLEANLPAGHPFRNIPPTV